MDLYHNIRTIRDKQGVSQAEMARRLDLDPSAYHRLEHRGNKLSIEQVAGIANALGISLIELLTFGEVRESNIEENTGQNDQISYRKRISELEDRLNDKQFIIEIFKKNISSTDFSFYILFDSIGSEMDLGTQHTESFPYEQDGEASEAISIYRDYTDQDVIRIIDHIREDHVMYYEVLVTLAQNNIVDINNQFAKVLLDYNRKHLQKLHKKLNL